MKKLLFAVLVALGVPLVAFGAAPHSVIQIPLAIDYDLDSTAFVYPVSQGQIFTTVSAGGRVDGVLRLPGIPGHARIETSGSSTTVTAETAGTNPFQGVQVGDFIIVTGQGNAVPDFSDAIEGLQTVTLKVVTRTDADNITVNQAVDLSAGASFYWRRAYASTQIGYGWVPVRGFDVAKFAVSINQASTTSGIDVRVECRDDWTGLDTGSPHIVYPYPGATCNFGTLATSECTFTGSGILNNLVVTIDNASAWHECRVGLKLDTTDDGSDTGGDAELIRVEFTGVVNGGAR